MIDLKTLSSADLINLIADAQAELASRPAAPAAAITASVKFDSYNDRRYSKPWIARVSKWAVGGRAEIVWGNYLGDYRGGTCEVACKVGDVIRYGQKDTRGGGGFAAYAVVLEDGETLVLDEATAAGYYRSDAASRAALISKWIDVRSERNILLARAKGLLDEWRADQSNRDAYNQSLAAERAAKDLIYTL